MRSGVYYLGMDELEISGKRYISTRRAAREHGYHSDYMGQLIRGKKVAGQKVGRAWYIEEDSLNIYLGKALAPISKAAPVAAPTATPAPAPVEYLAADLPAPVVAPEPQGVVEVPASAPVAPAPVERIVIKEEPRPVVLHTVQKIAEPAYAQPIIQQIHHTPYTEGGVRHVPIHIPAVAVQEMGGLRYAADDAPTLPVVTRMPVPNPHPHTPVPYPPAQQPNRFPYISLSLVGMLVVLATAFASNFISATVVSEQGKAATVQYAIHW